MVNGIKYNQPMPGNDLLSASEIAHIIDYINHSWGNDVASIPQDSVAWFLDRCN